MTRNRNRFRGGNRRPVAPPPQNRPTDSQLAGPAGIDAFVLFCSYHLGIAEDGGYKFQNIHHVAKRFKTNAGVIRQVLAEFRMDPDAIVHSSFDLAEAQVDIMLAPEGISRVELAREFYREFLESPRRDRNWTKELADDARENERIFGRGSGGKPRG